MTERVKFVGVKGVAAWCGVDPTTVSQWMLRHPGKFPDPPGSIGELDIEDEDGNTAPERVHPDWGWLPEQKNEWLRFAQMTGFRRFLGTEGSTR